MMPTDVNQPVDSTGYVLRPLRAKESVEAYFYYRFTASYPQPVRDMFRARWGMPMGCFDPDETPEHRSARVAQLAGQLLGMGYNLDAALVGGMNDSDQTPLSLQVIRTNQASSSPGAAPAGMSQDPESYRPWPDMVVTAKPFSWLNEPPQTYLYGMSDDRDGVGAIYQSNGKERWDVSARWTDGVKVYEKVPYNHHWNSTRVWERIA